MLTVLSRLDDACGFLGRGFDFVGDLDEVRIFGAIILVELKVVRLQL